MSFLPQHEVPQRTKESSSSLNETNSSQSSSKSMLETSSNWGSSRSDHFPTLNFGSLIGCCLRRKQKDSEMISSLPETFSVNSSSSQLHGSLQRNTQHESSVIIFTLSEIMKATSNFSPSFKIGQGGFGTVYKGQLKDGTIVAVKRAKKNPHDSQLSTEFRNEVTTLSNIEHLNLVKLIGYVEERSERIMVVEYVANGNLREHLDGHYGIVLDLAMRLDIAIDIAHALTYLHLYADKSIIHRDIKSSNILLTENFRAKVADFGFSRLGPSDFDASHVSTQVKGTAGYLDPEYLKTSKLTQKSDVYSYGVLLIEIFTGRRPIEQKRDSKERITTSWALQMFANGKAFEVLDPRIERTSSASLLIEKVLELAFQCASPQRHERPTMKKTTEFLWKVRKDFQNSRQRRNSESRELCKLFSEKA
ncbi:hypothetical protein KP509_26G026200 [Ceratopteris richardii]|uniref:non-specific serine/threonine protein kinase n=1 Tax=Ceratopteris richardii TaxID=49495 RepID=A0A8T2RJ28_CERRI|nr:hypothetical protein KP509_26G026200 [Ceratopteris richardii]KAH7296512.1 hypothetical protein KP509_26G026200 [Ceratopteris richardii]